MWQDFVSAFIGGVASGAAEQHQVEMLRKEYQRFINDFAVMLDSVATSAQADHILRWINYNLHKYDL